MAKLGKEGFCEGCNTWQNLNIFGLCDACWDEYQPFGRAWVRRQKEKEKWQNKKK